MSSYGTRITTLEGKFVGFGDMRLYANRWNTGLQIGIIDKNAVTGFTIGCDGGVVFGHKKTNGSESRLGYVYWDGQ